MDLGDFGTPGAPPERRKPEDLDRFRYFGTPIRVSDSTAEIDLIDYMDACRRAPSEGLVALATIKTGLRLLVFEDDFETFWTLAREKYQGIEALTATLLDVGKARVTASTELPTQRPTGSSGGPASTPSSSTGWPSSADYERQGRPDLALVRSQSVSVQKRLEDLAV